MFAAHEMSGDEAYDWEAVERKAGRRRHEDDEAPYAYADDEDFEFEDYDELEDFEDDYEDLDDQFEDDDEFEDELDDDFDDFDDDL